MSGQSTRTDWYGVLGVPPDATQSQIDRAYRTLVRWYHPDSRPVTSSEKASEADRHLRDVMTAYRVVGHPDRRADYDRRRHPSASAGTVPVRVRPSRTIDEVFVTAGPVHWTPSPGHLSTTISNRLDGAAADNSRGSVSTRQTSPRRQPSDTSSQPPGRDASRLVPALTRQIQQLTIARDSNRRIGIALGILMSQLGIEDTEAFNALRRSSQNTNRKLRDIAEDVIQAARRAR